MREDAHDRAGHERSALTSLQLSCQTCGAGGEGRASSGESALTPRSYIVCRCRDTLWGYRIGCVGWLQLSCRWCIKMIHASRCRRRFPVRASRPACISHYRPTCTAGRSPPLSPVRISPAHSGGGMTLACLLFKERVWPYDGPVIPSGKGIMHRSSIGFRKKAG
jgi:hypothetical protein